MSATVAILLFFGGFMSTIGIVLLLIGGGIAARRALAYLTLAFCLSVLAYQAGVA